jgi:GNAT superfamily N-acetyltransferase
MEILFDPLNPDHLQSSAKIWNAACGADLAITPEFLSYNTRPTTGIIQNGFIMEYEAQPAGFILTSALVSDPAMLYGWVDAVAVSPSAQHQGIGSKLLSWAENWLQKQGCQQIFLGSSLRPFTPGLPGELDNDSTHEAFFVRRGFSRPKGLSYTWDMGRRLLNYQSIYPQSDQFVELQPLKVGQENNLLMFLQQSFPGRWLFEYQEHLREGGRLSDYLLLWHKQQVVAFCQITLPDSVRSLDRFYPHRLPKPWGQLGTIGVDQYFRGRGFGGRLIDQALLHLQALGVDGCIIDWTSLLDLYGKFGFTPYRRYLYLSKMLY